VQFPSSFALIVTTGPDGTAARAMACGRLCGVADAFNQVGLSGGE